MRLEQRRSLGDGLLCFDLENRGGAYWFEGTMTSEITAFGWKWRHEDEAHSMVLLRNGRFSFDGEATVSYEKAHARFGVELARAAVVYGHNIRRHDLPMLSAWRWRLKLSPLPALLTTDTCRDVPKRGGFGISLDNLAAVYGLEGEKLRMTQWDWEKANRLEPDGVSKARARVVGDVLLQEQLREAMLADNRLKGPKIWRA